MRVESSVRLIVYILMLGVLISYVTCYSSPSSCKLSSQFYNYFTHACETCPTNTEKSALDVSYCNCTLSRYPNPRVIGFKYSTSC
jgi:hypothetical protein